MPRTITFEGRRIVVPDDATDSEITTILEAPPSRQMPAATPQKVPSLMDRLARKGGPLAAAGRAQPQTGYGTGQIIEVEAPDGSIVEFPAGTSDDVMAKAMRSTFGGPAPATGVPQVPAVPPAPPPSSSDLDAMIRGSAPRQPNRRRRPRLCRP